MPLNKETKPNQTIAFIKELFRHNNWYTRKLWYIIKRATYLEDYFAKVLRMEKASYR